MEKLDSVTQDEVRQIIERVLDPVKVRVLRFESSYQMTHRYKMGNEPWQESKETLYTVVLEHNGEEFLDKVSSTHLKNSVKDAVGVLCHDLCYSGRLNDEEKEIVLRRIYSEEFFKDYNEDTLYPEEKCTATAGDATIGKV